MSLRRHLNNDVKRGFTCEFCGEHLQTSDDMGTHLISCASKTNKCRNCNKHISRRIFAYHTNHDCVDPNLFDEVRNNYEEKKKETETIPHRSLLNSRVNSTNERTYETNTSSGRTQTKSTIKFEPLLEKAANAQKALTEQYYQSEVDHVAQKLQFNIIVMGSPRVGKSELINALCNGKKLAETSFSLNSCTKEVKCYVLESQQQNSDAKAFKINFYDTPGIESWNNNEGTESMIQFIKKTDPVCVIYCASPGSFAKLDQLHAVLDYCKTKEIFCALVCTNMWSGNTREMVINEFQKELAFFGDKTEKFSAQPHSQTPHKITFFGKGALCTMVNSIEYYDPDFSTQRKPVQGIDELIHGIMEALDEEKLLGWCYAVLYRRSYWEKISQKIGGFFSLRVRNLYDLVTLSPEGTASNFVTYFSGWIFKKKT